MLSARSFSSTSPHQPNSATQPPSSGTLSPSPYGFQNSPSQDPNASLLSRLQLCVEIIEKEYTQFNTKNATRKQKKIIPRLFYSFYPSSLCTNFIVACFEYLEDFLRHPMKDGESLNLNGPGTHRGDGREAKVKASDKVLLLQERLQRVAECWSSILLYRAEMNRHETITVSNTMKRSEHFLNDTFDAYFFEALYLLVEYVIEFQFLDRSRAQLETKNTPIVSTTTPVANSSPSVTSPNNPVTSPTSAKATSKSATATAAEIERNWRLVQHELQRIIRTRNFNFSQKAHVRERASNVNKGNGLNHAPLGNALAGVAASGTRRHKASGKNSLSYRDPMTFRLNGPRKWNEDPIDAADAEDTRALSHLPGHFRTKGALGVNECLDLRSPLIASVLPNPRTMAAINDKYVFGTEVKRNAGKRRFGGRLTHAEEKYLTEQHAKQEKREMEVKLRTEREAREEAEREEAEEHRRLEEENRMHDSLEEGGPSSFRVEVQPEEESKEQMPESITLSLPFTNTTATANNTSTSILPLVPNLKLPASNSSTLRPTPPMSAIHSVIQSSANSPHATRPPSATASTAALNSSRSIRTAASLTARPPQARPPQRSAASARLVRLDPNLAVQVAQLDRQPEYIGRAPSLDEKLKSFAPIISVDRTSNRISFRDLRF